MKNATNPVPERLRSGMANSGAPASVVDISVAGNVDGNIVVGDNNFIYTVHNHYGAVVNKHTAPSVKRRRLKQQPPRLPPGFIGRESDLNKLRNHIKSKDAVLVYGHDGIGKTALVKQAANSDPAKAMPDGVVYMQGVDEKGQTLGVQDTIQLLFDALFESNPPLKVTPASARTYLSNTRPLVVLNRFEFSSTGLNSLVDLLPKGALVITSRNAPGDDGLQHLRLLPLAREEAIQILVSKSGLALDETTRVPSDKICELLGDIPLAISKTANLIRDNRITLAAVVGSLQAIQPPSQGDNIRAAIERSYGLVYSVLNQEEREALAVAASAPGISVDRAWLESMAGGEKTIQALESLELLQANSPRLRLAEGMRQVIQSGRRDLQALRESQLYHLLGQLKSRALDFEFMSAELGNILGLLQWAANEKRWSEVITLGRAVDPYLTLNGLWDAWEGVLNQVLAAGQNMKDLAVQAWVFHQLGTREMGIGSLKQAINLLVRALQMRESLGDRVGAAYTRHNLDLILPPETPDDSKGNPPSTKPPSIRWPRGWTIPVLLGIAAIAAFIIILMLLDGNNDGYPMPEGWQVYRVQDGDTLDSISQRVTFALNKELDEKQFAVVKLAIVDGNHLSLPTEVKKGQRLYVPVAPLDPEPTPVESTAVTPDGNFFQPQATPPPADLKLDLSGKAQDTDTFHLVGEMLNYSYVIVNTSSQPLPGPVDIKDDKATTTCPEIKSLASDEAVTCTGTYIVTQVDIDFGSVTNNAIALMEKAKSNDAAFTVHAIQGPALTLSKAATPTTYDHVDQIITYSYTILNNGNVTLSPVQFMMRDDHINGGKQFNCGPETNELAPNATVTCTATYNITQADVDARSVTNSAFAVAYGLRRQLITTLPSTITVNYTLPVTLTKTADPKTYDHVDQIITYSYSIQNINSVPLPGPVDLSDDRAATVTCPEVKSLASTGTVTCMGTYVITQADLDYGSVTNHAKARIDGTESDQATFTVYAVQHPELAISKAANPTTYEYVGQTITYTYAVTNTGNVTLDPTTLSVSDDLINGSAQFHCGSEKTKFAPKETITCPATTYTITQADADASSVTNGATASIVYNGIAISSPRVTSTITYACPYPPAGWDPYIIQPRDSLSEISSWYGNTVLDLQRANCMGLSDDIYAGDKLYVPYVATITGTVFADPDGNGEQNPGEPVLAGFMVPISRIGGNFTSEVRTNQNGVYIIPNLPPGNYLVLYAPVNLTSRVTLVRNFGLRPVP